MSQTAIIFPSKSFMRLQKINNKQYIFTLEKSGKLLFYILQCFLKKLGGK